MKGRRHILSRPVHQVFENNFCFPFCTPRAVLGEEVLNDIATASSFCDYLSNTQVFNTHFFLNSTHFWLPMTVLLSRRPYISTGAKLCSEILLATGYRAQKVSFSHVTRGEQHMKCCCQRRGTPEEDRTPPEQVHFCKSKKQFWQWLLVIHNRQVSFGNTEVSPL